MAESYTPVTGTGSIVGFAHGAGYGYGDRTFRDDDGFRDVLGGQRDILNGQANVINGQRHSDQLNANAHGNILDGQRHSDNLNADGHRQNIEGQRLGNGLTTDASFRNLEGQRFSDKLTSDGHAATQVAVEKVGAAAELSTEKTSAATQLLNARTAADQAAQAERIRADQLLQQENVRKDLADQNERYNIANVQSLSDIRLEQQRQHCELERKIAECCCKLESSIASLETNRVKEDLANARAELIALRARGNGPGNS